MGSFDWNKMLAKDLNERIHEKQKVLEDLKKRKQMELEQNTRLNKKRKIQQLLAQNP